MPSMNNACANVMSAVSGESATNSYFKLSERINTQQKHKLLKASVANSIPNSVPNPVPNSVVGLSRENLHFFTAT